MKKNYFKNINSSRVFLFLLLGSLNVLTAQTWVGGTSSDFLDGSNWSAVPTFDATSNFTVNAVVAPNNNPVLSADYPVANNTSGVVAVSTGATLTTNGNITTSTSTNAINGTLNVNGGIYKSRLYIGNSTSSVGVVNVATGGTLLGVGVWRISVDQSPSSPGTLNINGGTYEMTTGSGLTIGGASAARKGILNVNSGLVKFTGTATLSLGNAGTTVTGTVNQAGGALEYNVSNFNNGGIVNITGGSFKLLNTTGTTTINASSTTTTGIINIGGGTLDASGPLTIGSTTTGTLVVNLNSGSMNLAGALTVLPTAIVNIDAGSIVLTGNQTAAVATLISDGRIALSGAALTAGKVISNTYNAGTDKTTVVASASLGVNDVTFDANSIAVYAQNKSIKIQSGNLLLEVQLYDLSGRLVTDKKGIGANETTIDLNGSKGVYVVKAITVEGESVSKKVVL